MLIFIPLSDWFGYQNIFFFATKAVLEEISFVPNVLDIFYYNNSICLWLFSIKGWLFFIYKKGSLKDIYHIWLMIEND